MKVVWTETALHGLEKVTEYIALDFGQSGLNRFVLEIKKCENAIAALPNSGAIEWKDDSHAVVYRFYMVNGLSKMLYFVKNDTVYIADFWDIRSQRS